MNFKTVLCIFTITIYMHEILSVTIQISTIETSNRKKITFFSDKHKSSPGEKEQITSLIDFLQEQRDNHTYHMLVEQASALNKLSASDYGMLYTLDKHIETAQPPMAHVRLDNIEIRHIAGPAMDILSHYKLYRNAGQYTADDGIKTIGTITFQDVLDEFDRLKQSLSDYYSNQTDGIIFNIYKYYIGMADRDCEKFKRKILSNNDIVLEYAKARVFDSLQVANLSEKKENLAEILGKDMELTFNHLFDLNLLKNILSSDCQNILVFAGGDHTREVITMLATLEATSLFHATNLKMEESIENDSQKGCCKTQLPITGQQIVQALSVQPKKISFSSVPTICYMTLAAAALYYLVFVVIPGQTLYGYA